MLDRAITYGVDLYDALKIGLISMDSTMRSNLGVGMPIDVLVARRDACDAELSHRIEPGEPYFHDLRERWSAALARGPYRFRAALCRFDEPLRPELILPRRIILADRPHRALFAIARLR